MTKAKGSRRGEGETETRKEQRRGYMPEKEERTESRVVKSNHKGR